MIGIKMKPNIVIPVHYQKGDTLQKGNPPLPTYNTPPPPIYFYFYFICTKIVLQEKILPPLPPKFFLFL